MLAQAKLARSAEYEITTAVTTGGATSLGGAYAVHGTNGQPVSTPLQGGSFRVAAGFWPMLRDSFDIPIFDDGFESGGLSRWSHSEPPQ